MTLYPYHLRYFPTLIFNYCSFTFSLPPPSFLNRSLLKAPLKRSHEEGKNYSEPSRKFPKILGAMSISNTNIFNTIEIGQNGQRSVLPCNIPNFVDYRSTAGIIFADKTLYIEQLEKIQPNYRCTFLRPRGFGKSVFLSMLCAYYDIQATGYFNELFGPLHIGKNPTPWHNKHLVLKFDLSSISVSGSFDEMRMSFHDQINDVLKEFIKKYEEELGYPEVDNLIKPNNSTQSLKNALTLVSKRGHSLFVGVDEYDAPVNNFLNNTAVEKVQRIEQFFKESFFAVLKEGCGGLGGRNVVISKYFLTGVTPAFRTGISPLSEAILISGRRELHGICGFTENEIKIIVQYYLKKTEEDIEPIIDIIRKLYNGYFFASSDYDISNPQPPLLYNPHLVFHYISEFSSHGFVAKPKESTTVHSEVVLKSIPDIGDFSVEDLENIVILGDVRSEIKTGFGFDDILNVGKDRVITWSLLYYLGILTRGPDGNLKIPNDIIKSDVLKRITYFLRAQDKFQTLIDPAFRNLVQGSINDFANLLGTYLETRSIMSLQTANESMLQSVVELLLDVPSDRMSELYLVVDGTKTKGNGRFGFVDIFLPPMALTDTERTIGVVLELKDITLLGLLRGLENRWNLRPSYKDYDKLAKRVSEENEDELLARTYMYWSDDQRKPMSTTVGSILGSAIKQCNNYMRILLLGKPKDFHSSGVLDPRIRVDVGNDNLQGHVIMAIGGRRILMRSTGLIPSQKNYQSVVQF